jgi:hypothetical protein
VIATRVIATRVIATRVIALRVIALRVIATRVIATRGCPVGAILVIALFIRRANTRFAPTRDQHHDTVNVVRHDGKCAQFHVIESRWHVIPNGLNHPSRVIHFHFSICDFPEQTFTAVGANGDEIGSGLGIIISLQTD